MASFCASIRSDWVSVFIFLFLCYVHVFSLILQCWVLWWFVFQYFTLQPLQEGLFSDIFQPIILFSVSAKVKLRLEDYFFFENLHFTYVAFLIFRKKKNFSYEFTSRDMVNPFSVDCHHYLHQLHYLLPPFQFFHYHFFEGFSHRRLLIFSTWVCDSKSTKYPELFSIFWPILMMLKSG